MKTISDAFATMLQSGTLTLATCVLIVRTDGATFAYTSCDDPFFFDIYAERLARGANAPAWMNLGGVFYRSNPGYVDQDLQTGSTLATDTTEIFGPMNSVLTDAAITEDDCLSGLFDYARFCMFLVDWSDLTTAKGALPMRTGRLGRVFTESTRGQFSVELNGLTQALQSTFGRFLTPACAWRLGDARCRVDLTPFTVTGAIEAINDDFVTFYDSTRTETGPVGGANVTNVSNANPGQVTVDDPTNLYNGLAVVIAGVVGPALVNTITTIANLTGDTFDLPIDTSDTSVYPAYSSDGTVTPLGVTSGYFDGGLLTWTSGLNVSRSMDVKSSAVGQFTLHQKMPRQVQVGDTYTLVAGCDKTMPTCADKFSNSDRHGGFPYVIGIDLLAQATNS